MWPSKVIHRAPPFKLERQLTHGLSCTPRAARQCGDQTAEREIEPLDERRLHTARETDGAQSCLEGLTLAQTPSAFNHG
jgi:hypothetical protein